MVTINVSLPESLKAFVDDQVAEGKYPTASEFIGDLLQEAQKRKAREKVEALLLEGLNSGEATPMTDQDWKELRQELHDRLAQSQGS